MVATNSALLNKAQPVLDKIPNPAYWCSWDHRFVAYNPMISRLMAVGQEAIDRILGGYDCIDVLLDPQLKLRPRFTEQSWEPLVVGQLRKIRQAAERNPMGQQWLESFVTAKQQYGEFAALWEKSLMDADGFEPYERTHLEIVTPQGARAFYLVAYPYPDVSHYIIEYHAADQEAMDYLADLRSEGQGQLFGLRDLSNALRNINLPKKLARSPLVHLDRVKAKVRGEKVTTAVALQQVMAEILEDMRDLQIEPHRTLHRLKYEILYMMAHYGATDEQMMWDLGFESDDFWAQRHPDLARKPRYPYAGKGDYPATSRASFKRLKARALTEFKWRVEEKVRSRIDN